LEKKNDGGVVVTSWRSYKTCKVPKFQSNHYHQQINIQLFYRPDALPTQPTASTHRREELAFHRLAHPKLKFNWGFSNPVFDH